LNDLFHLSTLIEIMKNSNVSFVLWLWKLEIISTYQYTISVLVTINNMPLQIK